MQAQEEAIRSFVRVNHRIRVPEIRCVGPDGAQLGLMATRDAMRMAEKEGYDLVEIVPQAQPPVCKIMDYGKYKYEEGKKERGARKHQSQTKVKEIQFRPNVGEHDYQTKLRHVREFLEEGHRVKVGLFFRGRENAHKELGFDLLNRVIKDLDDVGKADQTPKFMGRNLFMLLSPRVTLKAKREAEAEKSADSAR